jgi:hypothetical protein
MSYNGFLSEEAIQKNEEIKRAHKQLFFYLDEVNEQAHRYRGVWRVRSENVKELFGAALFHRSLTAYQALILLTRRNVFELQVGLSQAPGSRLESRCAAQSLANHVRRPARREPRR